jgi:hypothetical protein
MWLDVTPISVPHVTHSGPAIPSLSIHLFFSLFARRIFQAYCSYFKANINHASQCAGYCDMLTTHLTPAVINATSSKSFLLRFQEDWLQAKAWILHDWPRKQLMVLLANLHFNTCSTRWLTKWQCTANQCTSKCVSATAMHLVCHTFTFVKLIQNSVFTRFSQVCTFRDHQYSFLCTAS